MGACNSSSGGVVQGLERHCARGIRGRRGRTSSSSSSSSVTSASSGSNSVPTRCTSQIPEADSEAAGKATAPNQANFLLANNKTAEETFTGQQPSFAGRGSSELDATTTTTTTTNTATKSDNNDPLESGRPLSTSTTTNGDEKENRAPEQASEAELLRRRERLVKLKEGVDFIETEEDAEAVESAVVKIQSTFRGKKIRSKLGGAQSKPAAAAATTSTRASKTSDSSCSKQADSTSKKPADSATSTGSTASQKPADEELSKRVATMQVNDGSDAHEAQKGSNQPALPEDEAERAATKIQAGFKGYKTRKELEGKLGGQQAPVAPTGDRRQQPARD